MAYSSTSGRRPFEWASKSTHHHIIKDENVESLLRSCWVPPEAEAVDLSESQVISPAENLDTAGVRSIICIDGGYTESTIRARYPSVKVCFFQFGALTFTVSDLNKLDQAAFLRPEDMQRLKNLERIKLALALLSAGAKVSLKRAFDRCWSCKSIYVRKVRCRRKVGRRRPCWAECIDKYRSYRVAMLARVEAWFE
jgi:hypothetical protein